MIIVVGGIKGGSGKTTLCTNLVVLRSRSGKKTILIDADEQKSATDWSDQRNASGLENTFSCMTSYGAMLLDKCKEIGDEADILIDVGGRDTKSQRAALCIADVFLTPFQPRSMDIWTLNALEDLLLEVRNVNPNLKSLAVINRADHTGSDNKEVCKILKNSPFLELVPVNIGQRKSFSNAIAEGLAVIELKRADALATAEITTLYKYVFGTKYIQGKYHGSKAEIAV